MKPSKLNTFLLFNLPSAYLCGVRVKYMDDVKCVVTVKHRWINQNPFKSMYWVVQGMAAELTIGTLLMNKIKESGKKVSMLVAGNNATFTKKAIGRITFECSEGHLIDEIIKKTIDSGEGETIWLNSRGINAEGLEVSSFNFEWTIKLKS